MRFGRRVPAFFHVKIAAEEVGQPRKDFNRIQDKLFIADKIMPGIFSILKTFPERDIPSPNCIFEW
jgi:hypothetical protein